ncbi:MAG: YwiC-like family protein [Nocardioidaceae bacterium]|nr:YwiC-like family protein [Nocardioidaceae bacterium]
MPTRNTRTSPAPARSRRDPVVPPQHGAWGFLGLPLLTGVAAAGWSPWALLLAVAWVAAYPCSWAVTGLLTARRPERFRRAALVWAPPCVLAGVLLLVTHVWLVWVLLAYLVLFAVNLQQARRRRERSIENDLVLIAECTLLVPVLAGVVDGASGLRAPISAMTTTDVLLAMLVTALTLVGSTLHVKSLIRERNNPAYTTASRVVAVLTPFVLAAACLATGTSAWLAAPFVLLAARAVWWHDPTWRPARIGLVELAAFVLVAVAAFIAL